MNAYTDLPLKFPIKSKIALSSGNVGKTSLFFLITLKERQVVNIKSNVQFSCSIYHEEEFKKQNAKKALFSTMGLSAHCFMTSESRIWKKF